jgi:hypothetical protein
LIHARVAIPTFDHDAAQAATSRQQPLATDRNHCLDSGTGPSLSA